VNSVRRRDERCALAEFQQRYAAPLTDVNAIVERAAIGGAWGVNGYTTIEQAAELGRRLRLTADGRLLDVGTGRGWPGLFLAARTDCTIIGTDMPLEALSAAARRARSDRIDDRASFVVAAGAWQPFRAGSFDAVVHTDVLC
jgi:methylase of polypeptide subunit release factors